MSGTTSNSVLNVVSTLKEKNGPTVESVLKPHMNGDSHTNAFKRHKIHFSPKDEMAVEISQTPPSSATSSVFVTPGIYKRKLCKPRVKQEEEVKFSWIHLKF